jgi:hypothetical protein
MSLLQSTGGRLDPQRDILQQQIVADVMEGGER